MIFFITLSLWYLPLHAQTSDVKIVVRKGAFTLQVHKNDSLLKTFPVAVGLNAGDKQRRGDNRTPEGEFVISRIHDSRNWVHDFRDGKGPVGGAYGPWFLRLETGSERTSSGKSWTGIGIHGTHDPSSIGSMVTEGCVRLTNADLEELRTLVQKGTPVKILP